MRQWLACALREWVAKKAGACRLLVWVAAVMLLLVFPRGSHGQDKPAVLCDRVWQSIGPLAEMMHGVPNTVGLPDGGEIRGLQMKSLYLHDGTQFEPSTIFESSCYLDRVLPNKARAALVDAAQSVLSRSRGQDNRTILEGLFRETDVRFDSMFDGQGSFLALLDYLAFELKVAGFRSSSPLPLERDAFSHGVYFEGHIMRLLWLSYLRHRGVMGVEPLIGYVVGLNRSLAPPAVLSSKACRAGIDYQWPTVSDPIKTFLDVQHEGEYVHWGVCPSAGTLWVYSYKKGWRKVPDEEAGELCERAESSPMGDRAAKLSEFCKARHR